MYDFDANGNLAGSLRAVSERRVADVRYSHGWIIGHGTTPIGCCGDTPGYIQRNGPPTRGWSARREEENGRRVHYLRRLEQTPAEGYYSCYLHVDINNPRGVYILYPSEWRSLMIVRDVLSHSSPPVTAVTATIEVVRGTSTFRVRCTSCGGRALDMDVSGPNGDRFNISSKIQPMGTRNFRGSDNYTATTKFMPNGTAGDVYQCNVTSVASRIGSVTVEGNAMDTCNVIWLLPVFPQLLKLQPSTHWSKQTQLQ